MEKGIPKLQNPLDNLYVARAELHAGMQIRSQYTWFPSEEADSSREASQSINAD